MTVYLDHAATTPVLPAAAAVLADELVRAGNPSSLHASGRAARRTVEEARERLAGVLGAGPSEVVFTSGGTEANNMAVLGFTAGPPGTIALTAGEHPAVMEACRHLAGQGW